MNGKRSEAGRLLAALLVFGCGLYAAPKAAAAFRNVQAGAEAPAFKLKDLSGNDVSLESFKSDNAVLVVFWATWSSRSLEELSDVQKLVAEFGPKGLKAVAVNVEHEHATDEDMKAIREKAASLKLSFPVVLDSGLETFRNYGVVAVPSTAVLGPGNVLREAHNGYPSFVFLELKGQVEGLLGLRKAEAVAAAKPDTGYKPARQALLNYNLGRRLYAFGMPDKAEPKLKAAAAADPKWAAPNVLLGDVYLAQAKKEPEGYGGEEGVRGGRRLGAGERRGAHGARPGVLGDRRRRRGGARGRRGAIERCHLPARAPVESRHPRPEGGHARGGEADP